MHRVTRATLGTVAVGLVAVLTVVGIVGGSLSGQLHSVSGQNAKGTSVAPVAKSTSHVAPAVHVNPSAIAVTAAFTKPTSPWPGYINFPFEVGFAITVTGSAIDNKTTTVTANITDVTAGVLLTSTPLTVAPGQTNYFINVTATNLTCNNPYCVGFPQDELGVTAYVNVNNTTLVESNESTIFHSFFLIIQPLVVGLISPVNTSAVSVGNVTWSVGYQGSYVANAVINVYGASGTLVFSHNMVEFVTGIPQSANWFAGQAGTYKYSIVMTTVYLPSTHYYNGTITVISKGGTVFQNSTTWKNTTLISGLSGAAAGTILLVVGLIVGMIVAMVLARAVMGRPAQAPPQPWEGKPGTTGAAAAPNTCSVCGKSFSTPEELAAHGKSEHGMQ